MDRFWLWTRWSLGSTGVALIAALTWLALSQPAIAAIGCPSCYGFERLGQVYVDRRMPSEMRTMLVLANADATARLTTLLGGIPADPVVLACSDEACERRIDGGGVRGMSYGTYELRLSPRGLDPVIVMHERTLIELNKLVGFRHWIRDDLPTWFVEGIAVVVSDNPQFLKPKGTVGSRCTTDPNGPLPATDREWRHLGATDIAIYARAGCRVLRWMDANGGSQAVRRVVAAVASGQAFSDAYRD